MLGIATGKGAEVLDDLRVGRGGAVFAEVQQTTQPLGREGLDFKVRKKERNCSLIIQYFQSNFSVIHMYM